MVSSGSNLYALVQSLSQSEKRSLRLYVNRLARNEDARYMELFDILDKLPRYDEPKVMRKMGIGARQKVAFHNLKRHLYQQILVSLRTVYPQKSIAVRVREWLDFASILYDKGLYMDSLRHLEKARKAAALHELDILHLEALEFRKLIEARHITRSRQTKQNMNELLYEAGYRSEITASVSELSNLTIEIQGYYIDHGHALDAAQRDRFMAYWNKLAPVHPPYGWRSFGERVQWGQARMWYHYILLELEQAYAFASEWVNLYSLYPKMRAEDPDLYIRSFYYQLTFQFLLEKTAEYERDLARFRTFKTTHWSSFNKLTQTMVFTYYTLALLNGIFLYGDYHKGYAQLPALRAELQQYRQRMDEHRVMLFQYKFAYVSFAAEEFSTALDDINEIVVRRTGFLRDDIQLNATLLQLICHYELNNLTLLHNLLPNLQRLVARSPETSQIHRLALQLLRKLSRTPVGETIDILQESRSRLTMLQDNKSERKALKYFDLVHWIDSRLRRLRGR